MLNIQIKEATKEAHQELEGKVVRRLKAIRSNADYAAVLKHFYAYFSALEQAFRPYLTEGVLPDYANRRHASFIAKDIEALGADLNDLPPVTVPAINSTAEALGALYVMEGSIMGGPYIVQMLQKGGINEGLSFFSGYGENTGRMWGAFTEVLNNTAQTEAQQTAAVEAARATFANFSLVFGEVSVA